jgi:DNA repair protein RecN (Recombination protein N)
MLELQDASAELRGYAGGLAADPERLAFLDDRLDGYERLKRKHGGTIEAVLAHAEQCREDRARLVGSRDQIEEATDRLEDVRTRQLAVAKEISKARRKAAPKLSAAVRERLADLALADASFEIEISTGDGAPGPTGSDVVEFMIAPNPGIAASPLRETASGGELSRVMLALLTASGADGDQTFVFDEIDAGIGGHTARAVGEQLRALGQARQVICITHLPQVAAAAERHFQIEKSSAAGDARTDVRQLNDKAVVEELCRMLGADGDDAAARKHARQLLAGAAQADAVPDDGLIAA